MGMHSHKYWELEIEGTDNTIQSLADLQERVAMAAKSSNGRLFLSADAGPRPLWQRILGAKRFVELLFAIEWCEGFATLMFYDENASEYRAIDKEHPVSPSEDVRRRIAHGEVLPCPVDECMEKTRAFRALSDFMSEGNRPEWLAYKKVG